MKQMQSDQKYVIAWFKIAEFVSRGEKERALGVYRLLSHSIDDPALAMQLEADILFACNDERCFDVYMRAADEYEKYNKTMQRAAVCEQMLAVRPDHIPVRIQLVKMYAQLVRDDLAFFHAKELIRQQILKGSSALAYETMSSLEFSIQGPLLIEIYELFLQTIIVRDSVEYKFCLTILHSMLDVAISLGSMELQKLVTKIEAVYPDWKEAVHIYLKTHSIT
jgi:hypothetical protein